MSSEPDEVSYSHLSPKIVSKGNVTFKQIHLSNTTEDQKYIKTRSSGLSPQAFNNEKKDLSYLTNIKRLLSELDSPTTETFNGKTEGPTRKLSQVSQKQMFQL